MFALSTGMLLYAVILFIPFPSTSQAETGYIVWGKKQLGNDCSTLENGAVTKCKVAKGSQADLKGEFQIHGDVQSLSITLKWTNCANALTNSPICLKNGNLEIGCSSKIPAGTYPLSLKKITVPTSITNAKVLTAVVDVKFADGRIRKNYLVGNLEALLS